MKIDAQTRSDIEALVYEHAWRLDFHQSATLGELYLEAGRLHGIGPDRQGRASIDAYGSVRAEQRQTVARHVCTNLRLTPLENGRIAGQLIITLFRHKGEGFGPADPVAVADAHDVYARDDDGSWKLAERRLSLAFESEAHKL
ncbi:nuclear transport factor 2 family protein [Sphingobium sp. H39-3-25]|uniref:nuclear transport factor 2 family protein n=1 Tax=Sphingobium arseniciresistens TaxID=3030834 RepID=UPI0023B94442|nr:nuclear transport factor 2 family protein [Sphingobium arseniciresistens]